MNKIIILILIFTGFVANMHAQDQQDPRTDLRDKLIFGLKIGFNKANVYDTKGDQFNAKPKYGYATGLFAAIPLGHLLGIQPEILFSQKGFIGSGQSLGSPYNLKRTTNYIDVPLFVALKPSEFITLLAGPQYSYLIKQTDNITSSLFSYQQEQEFNTDNLRKNTLCFVVGADVTMKHLLLSGRFGWDVLNNNGNGTTTNPRYKNIWYQATIGYRFYY
jgi:hypothetical protein